MIACSPQSIVRFGDIHHAVGDDVVWFRRIDERS
jgi:hypothetical protein